MSNRVQEGVGRCQYELASVTTEISEQSGRSMLEATKGQRTIQEIGSHYGVHPNQLMQWKRKAIEDLSRVLTDRRRR